MKAKKQKNFDAELKVIARARKGDEKALNELITIYKKDLFQYCYYLTGNNSMAEDFLQETFIKAFKNLDKLQSDKAFKSWLHSIALHLYLDYRKPMKNQEHDSMENAPEVMVKSNKVELRDAINDVLEQLRDDEKECLLLVDLADNTYEETAKIMGISEDAVRWKIREARRKFISYMEENQMDFTGIIHFGKKETA